MQKKLALILLVIFFPKIAIAETNYFLLLKNNKVNVRYGPGFDYPIKYIYKKKNLPIKVIDKKENFRRIIDFKNNSGWIHASQLKKGKAIILMEDQILFEKSTKYSKPLFKASKGRLLLIQKCKNNWCKSKTENYAGWIEIKKVWGSFK